MRRAKSLSVTFIIVLAILAISLIFMHSPSHASDSPHFDCEYQLQQYNKQHPTAMLQASQLKHFICNNAPSTGYAIYEYDANSFTIICPGNFSKHTIPTRHHIACHDNPTNWAPYGDSGGGRAICNTDVSGTHQGAEGCQIDYY